MLSRPFVLLGWPPSAVAAVVDRRGSLVPLELRREKAGYVLNSLLVPRLNAAAGLLLEGVADVETIDKTWRLATGAPARPFQIYDVVGLTTAYNISAADPDPGARAWAAYLKAHYLDQGKTGVGSSEGFYRYECPSQGLRASRQPRAVQVNNPYTKTDMIRARVVQVKRRAHVAERQYLSSALDAAGGEAGLPVALEEQERQDQRDDRHERSGQHGGEQHLGTSPAGGGSLPARETDGHREQRRGVEHCAAAPPPRRP